MSSNICSYSFGLLASYSSCPLLQLFPKTYATSTTSSPSPSFLASPSPSASSQFCSRHLLPGGAFSGEQASATPLSTGRSLPSCRWRRRCGSSFLGLLCICFAPSDWCCSRGCTWAAWHVCQCSWGIPHQPNRQSHPPPSLFHSPAPWYSHSYSSHSLACICSDACSSWRPGRTIRQCLLSKSWQILFARCCRFPICLMNIDPRHLSPCVHSIWGLSSAGEAISIG